MPGDALAVRDWSGTQAGNMVDFVAERVGTGLYGERFGKIAYTDEFMGPTKVAPTLLKMDADKKLILGINLRRPRGKTSAELDQQVSNGPINSIDGLQSACTYVRDLNLDARWISAPGSQNLKHDDVHPLSAFVRPIRPPALHRLTGIVLRRRPYKSAGVKRRSRKCILRCVVRQISFPAERWIAGQVIGIGTVLVTRWADRWGRGSTLRFCVRATTSCFR